MKKSNIEINGVFENQITDSIIENTNGWKLFFEEPTGAEYFFINPFWGYSWDGTAALLKNIILTATAIDGRIKQHICVFKYNGQDKFAWCAWTRQLYDFNTKKYHYLEGDRLSRKIAELIHTLTD